ncbi:MAG: TetR/AcrR family transcriptional regulator [Spirochaetes bacterium]|nr:TetR/AcrR family transcriptional regulator [Spirochaetota bacterium]
MTKKLPKENRIEVIIKSAVSVFTENGYENTTMEKIAAEAGISKGGLYHHFSSKDEIFTYALKELCQPVSDFLSKAFESVSPAEGLQYFIEAYIDFWTNRETELSFFFLSFSKCFNNPALKDYYDTSLSEYHSAVMSLYDRSVEAGEMDNVDSSEAAQLLIAQLDGIIFYLFTKTSLKPAEAAAAVTAANVGRYLKQCRED